MYGQNKNTNKTKPKIETIYGQVSTMRIPQRRHKKTEFSFFSSIRNLLSYQVEEFKPDGKFIDKEFPPTSESLLGYSGNIHLPLKWVRAEQLCGNHTKIFSKILPGDLKQGYLGDCWFTAALSCLAEKPYLIQKIFKNNSTSEDGKYTLSFFKNGAPLTVTIDSLVPVNSDTLAPYGSSSISEQLWVLLIEKAYAKIHKNYSALIKGECQDAFTDLTGCPSDLCRDQNGDNLIPKFDWILDKVNRKNFLLTAAIDGSSSHHGQKAMKQKGLLIFHAYSLLEAKEESDGNGETVQLIKLRNPWSRFEWNGDYSDKSKLWTKTLSDSVHMCVDEKDGVFWMDYKDFSELFDILSFCDCNKSWQIQSLPFNFFLNTSKNPKETTSQFFRITVPKNTCLDYISLHQTDKRIPNSRPYIDIAAIVLKEPDVGDYRSGPKCVAVLESVLERFCITKTGLKEGTYKLIPYTSGVHFSKSRDTKRSANFLLHFSKSSTSLEMVGNTVDFKNTVNTKESAPEIEILNCNNDVILEAFSSFLEQRGSESRDLSGNFSVVKAMNGGLVAVGLKSYFPHHLNRKIDFFLDSGGCKNLVPTIESWQKIGFQKLEVESKKFKNPILVGLFVRKDNKTCHFSVDVRCKTFDY